MPGELVLIRGPSGSGKSTFVKKNFPSYVHCEADSFFMVKGVYNFDRTKLGWAHATCQRDVNDALSLGKNVVVSNTSTTLSEVNTYIMLAEKHKVPYRIIRLAKQFQNTHGVPESVVLAMQNRMVSIPGEEILYDY